MSVYFFYFTNYFVAMESELIKTAYKELEKLKKERPSWEVFNRINMLYGSISYLQSFLKANEKASSIDIAVNELVKNIGEKATIEFLKKLLNELKKDMDVISPHLSSCLIKKLRGKV